MPCALAKTKYAIFWDVFGLSLFSLIWLQDKWLLSCWLGVFYVFWMAFVLSSLVVYHTTLLCHMIHDHLRTYLSLSLSTSTEWALLLFGSLIPGDITEFCLVLLTYALVRPFFAFCNVSISALHPLKHLECIIDPAFLLQRMPFTNWQNLADKIWGGQYLKLVRAGHRHLCTCMYFQTQYRVTPIKSILKEPILIVVHISILVYQKTFYILLHQVVFLSLMF